MGAAPERAGRKPAAGWTATCGGKPPAGRRRALSMVNGKASSPEERPPVLEEWRRLMEAVHDFREAAPWERMWDSPVVGVQDPESGEIGCCSVMGAGGEVFGLMVFRGAEGLWAFDQIAAGNDEDASPWDARAAVATAPLIAFTLGGREEVPPEDRQVFKALGLRFRGRNGWPVLRGHHPGYRPWRLTAPEVRFLAAALAAVRAFSLDGERLALLKQLEEAGRLDARGGSQPVLTLVAGESGGWTTRMVELEPRPALPVDPAFDEPRARRLLRRVSRRGATWQLELLPAPFAVGEPGARPQATWLGVALDEQSGLALHTYAYAARDPLQPAEFLLAAVESVGQRPAEVRVCRRDTAAGLAPVAKALGCRLSRSRRLPEVEAFLEEMSHMGR